MQLKQDDRAQCATSDVTRRTFMQVTAGGLGAVALGTLPGISAAPAMAAASIEPETLVTTLYKSLSDQQKKVIAFGFDHPLRSKVDNNWFITKKSIGELLDKDQQAMVRDIFKGIHSEEYVEKVLQQVEHDNSGDGGFKSCAIAMFGEPGNGDFEFVFTGRHVTRRCDGNSVKGAAFGGPIFYGHAAESFNEEPHHPGNVYWYQAKRANEVYEMLDGKQRKQALVLSEPPQERATQTVALTGKQHDLPGIRASELSDDQKQLMRQVIGDVLAPYRQADVDESLKMIDANGFDNLHMAFYKQHDIGDDGVWDIWRIEGPAALLIFRGAPHVHAWIHIRQSAQAASQPQAICPTCDFQTGKAIV